MQRLSTNEPPTKITMRGDLVSQWKFKYFMKFNHISLFQEHFCSLNWTINLFTSLFKYLTVVHKVVGGSNFQVHIDHTLDDNLNSSIDHTRCTGPKLYNIVPNCYFDMVIFTSATVSRLGNGAVIRNRSRLCRPISDLLAAPSGAGVRIRGFGRRRKTSAYGIIKKKSFPFTRNTSTGGGGKTRFVLFHCEASRMARAFGRTFD